jgi:hypothetical protein
MPGVMALYRTRSALRVLEHTAAHAGCAMACSFASSAELEEAAIQAKRQENARTRHLRLVLSAATGLLLTALLCGT